MLSFVIAPVDDRQTPDRGRRLPLGGLGPTEGSSSTGRAPVSKTGGWGFESLLPCSPVLGSKELVS